jgi:peptidoglycan/LPS O-acetylase OafA/YrhL
MAPVTARRVVGLDFLRCCAIGCVLLAHGLTFLYPHVGGVLLWPGFGLSLYDLGHLGSFGVELFFVLSGFLIGGILLGVGPRLAEGAELLRFYCRRWFRTLPNYYLFLLINIAFLLWIFPQPIPWGQAARYLVFLQTFTGRHTFFFLESWSLCIEEWFYLIFPLLVFLVLRMRRNVTFAFLLVIVALYLASSIGRFFYAANPANTWADDIRETVLIRFDALMTGVLAAWVASRHPGAFARAPRLCALAGAALLLFCYCTCYWYNADNETLFAKTVRFNLISLGFALFMPLGAGAQATRSAWFNASAESFARWSYSMYLVHLPIHRLLRERWFPKNQTSALQGCLAFGAFLAGTIVLSALIYRFFERPATRMRTRFAFSREPAAPGPPVPVD